MLRKIRQWLSRIKFNVDDIVIIKQTITQEDPATLQRIIKVRKAFKDQADSIQARSLKPHSCKDPIGCQNIDCFKFIPDKIVGLSKIILKKGK